MNDFLGQITQLLANPFFWIILVGYYIVSAAIGAMEAPEPTSGHFYRWFFRFANGFAANLARAAVAMKLPVAEAAKPDQVKEPSAP